MPTFRKKPEIVDARQFTGGVQNGTDITHWIQANGANAHWIEGRPAALDAENDYDDPEYVYLSYGKFKFTYVHVGDWVILRQDGRVVGMRPEDFAREYEQV